MSFCILSFQGFESAATLGEETSRSRITVPRALIGAIVVTGLFYTFTSYAAVVGWGSNAMDKYASDTTPPTPHRGSPWHIPTRVPGWLTCFPLWSARVCWRAPSPA